MDKDVVVLQFEYVRREGRCNMIDVTCVRGRAGHHNFEELFDATNDAATYWELVATFEHPDAEAFGAFVEENSLKAL